MPNYDGFLYDTAEFGVSAGVDHILFQSREGSSASRDKTVTNSRGDGTLPQGESFEVQKIGIMFESDVSIDDRLLALQDGYLQFDVNDRTVFIAPLKTLVVHDAFSGHIEVSVAANHEAVGLVGDYFELQQPIILGGGNSFRVTLRQATACGAANQSVKCNLVGLLKLP